MRHAAVELRDHRDGALGGVYGAPREQQERLLRQDRWLHHRANANPCNPAAFHRFEIVLKGRRLLLTSRNLGQTD